MKYNMVAVGDKAVGKTCLLRASKGFSPPSGYMSSYIDNFTSVIIVDGEPVTLRLWDTAGKQDLDQIRGLSYAHTDVFLLCFDVTNRESLENIRRKWYPEVAGYYPEKARILVGCKTDLRQGRGDRTAVSYKDGSAFARTLRMKFFETSALAFTGIQQCFEGAVKYALKYNEAMEKRTQMSPADVSPLPEIEPSMLSDQWYHLLEDPKFSDVTFLLDDRRQLDAHKIMLSSASKVFAQAFQLPLTRKIKPGHVTIQLSADITTAIFTHVLEFLYTGTPRLPDDVSVQYLEDLIRVASIFKLPYLMTICHNVMDGEYYLNHRITAYLNHQTAYNIKELYFNQPDVADVVFDIGGREVFAHKAVLASRCDVMAAMFGGSFLEAQQSGKCKVKIPNTTYECFLAFLEYLYTDHAPIEGGDAVGILVLADEYCQSRLLNLCELYITEEVDRCCTKNIERADIDVIGLLLTAQRHNASQLSKWCLRFISTNYIAFSNRREFVMLTGDNKVHVEKNRWPPVEYLEEVEEYKRKRRRGQTCSAM